jgi:hypothetical protein
MNQDEAISVFTLMILEIANQKMKISSISKITDMSDILALIAYMQFSIAQTFLAGV